MKANGPKRKIFDAVDMMTADVPQAETGNGLQSLPVDSIKPFHDHPFRLYQGERLDDMVESIQEHGVLNPVIVRKKGSGYEMLSGHNRQNAAKLAGLTEIPAIVKEGLSDEEAYVYVIETNVLQRSFTDLAPSEKAAVLSARYEKVISQGRRNDILQEIEEIGTCGHDVHKLRSRDGILHISLMDGQARAILIESTDLVQEAKRVHGLSKIATAALGRTLTAAAMMGSMLKGKDESITTTIKGGGPIGTVLAVRGTLTVGDLIAAVSYNAMLIWPVSRT